MKKFAREWVAVGVVLGWSLGLGGTGAVAYAVGTILWRLDTAKQFETGELENVQLSSLGDLRLGRNAQRVPVQDVTSIWSLTRGQDGAVYAGTGNSGQVFRLQGATAEKVADTGSLIVSALAWGEKGVLYAGTLPEGKVFRLELQPQGPAKVAELAALEKADHVWALQFDPRRRILFAGTGPQGRIYAIDPSGRTDLYYEAEDAHILTLLLEQPGGALLAGTSPQARLLRVTGPGAVTAWHDFDATEVKALATSKNGDAYVAVNTFPEPPSLGIRGSSGSDKTASNLDRSRPKPGKGKLYRRWPNGNVEPLLEFDDGHLTSVELGPDGRVYAGTGAKGRVVAVDPNRVSYTIADVEERQVTALALAGPDPVFGTGDPGALYRLGQAVPALAEYRSPPLDAEQVSRWGRVEWRGEGQLTLQTRVGNTEKPDRTWTEWSAPLTRSGTLVASPAARYLQLRVRWDRDPAAVLRSLGLYYLPNNQRAVVTEVSVSSAFEVVRPEASKRGAVAKNPAPSRSARSPNQASKRSAVLTVSWEVDAPDGDDLRYRLFFREESESVWRSMLPSDQVLTERRFQWNTDSVPAGYYVVKVEGSDEINNPRDQVTTHEKMSAPVVIDNDPPLFRDVRVVGRRVQGTAQDGFGPLARLEYSTDGREWYPIFPDDQIFDDAQETFGFSLPDTLPPGPYALALRATDRAENWSTTRLLVTLP